MNAGATMSAAGVIRGLEGSPVGGGWSLWRAPACSCGQCPKRATPAAAKVVSVKGFGKSTGGVRLNLVSGYFATGLAEQQQQNFRRKQRDVEPGSSLSRGEDRSHRSSARDSFCHPSGLSILQLNFGPGFGSAAKSRRGSVRRSVGVAPLEESKPDAKDHTAQEQHTIANVPGLSFSEKPHHVSTVPEEVLSQVGGKAGSISFYARRTDSPKHGVESGSPSPSKRNLLSLIWPLGPFILVASVVLPPLYLRKIFGALLEDSLVTDFVILFFTETLFFTGASAFLYIAHISRQATAGVVATLDQKPVSTVYSLGYRLSAKIALGIGVLLPFATFVMVWPWTGPAAAAALAPYMIGLLVQLGFEHVIQANDSPVWPLVPVTFQMYRLHQLNRAAQLVAGLLFSLKGVEATAETMAINGSLQSLLFVLQVLGMLCLWSLGSFLTNQLPSNRGQLSTPSIP